MNGDPFNQQRVNYPPDLRRSLAMTGQLMIAQVEMRGKPGVTDQTYGNLVTPILLFRGQLDIRPVLYAEYRTTVLGKNE